MPGRAAAPVTLCVLGVLEAVADGASLRLGGPIQRAVLARILVAGSVPVSAERLVEDVWGGRAGPVAVHPFVSRLRRVLGRDAIPQRRGGYVVDRDLVTVDADRFVAEVDGGRRALARGADAEAAVLLESALDRWNGERAFAGVADVADVVVVDAEADRLDELRVAAAEALADAHMRLGRGGEDVDRLGELVQRYPLREPLAARQVMALYAAGRQADALAAYERCRRELADQLGVDPAPALRRVHAAVLAQEALGAVSAAGPALRSNLPQRARVFVERPELAALVETALDDAARRPVVLYGMPGAGKTELACELAHRRQRAGRAAWWVAAEDPAGTAAGLADLATALGIGARARAEDTRAALWAELDRAPGWVLVFDNADEPARLEPYLPTAVHGDVIITSRDQAWRRLARPIPVPSLTRAESIAYVVERSGDQDTTAAGELADLLGDLPLALQQACAYVEQTGMTVPDYVRLYRGRQAELGVVATTWGLAFDRLRRRSPLAAGVLETMSFLAADAVAVEMLWPLADGDELDVQEAIGELLRLSLVDRKGPILRVHRLVQDVVRLGLSPATATVSVGRRRAALPGRGGRRARRRGPSRPGRHAQRGAAAGACRPARRVGRGGTPVHPACPLPGRRAGAHRAAATGHSRRRARGRAGRDHPARHTALPARRGARRRRQPAGGVGPAPPCGRAAGRRAEGRRPGARARLQPLRSRPQLRRRHPGRHRGARAVAEDAAGGPPRRPRRPRAGRPRLHALGRRPARPRGRSPHRGP